MPEYKLSDDSTLILRLRSEGYDYPSNWKGSPRTLVKEDS